MGIVSGIFRTPIAIPTGGGGGPPTGPAGGDLSGTYPDPQVEQSTKTGGAPFLVIQSTAAQPSAVELQAQNSTPAAAAAARLVATFTTATAGVETAELALQSAVGGTVATRIRSTPLGGIALGTTGDPGAGNLGLDNARALRVKDTGGTYRDMISVNPGNSGVLGNTGIGSLLEVCGAGSMISHIVGGSLTQLTSNINQTRIARGRRIAYVQINDADYVALITDCIIGYSLLTTDRIVTLPSAVTVGTGALLTVKDESGSLPPNSIILTPIGGQSIDGAPSLSLTAAYSVVTIYSNGANWFTR